MSNIEIKQCQNCKTDFTIEPADFDFYKKIAVPPPTFCPECRMMRRFAWRNERSLHRRKCALSGKDIISCFPEESGVVVYDRDVWWSDQWDPKEFGRAYDFSRPFFTQFSELLRTAPMPAVFNAQSVRSDYCNHVGELKDSYLTFATYKGENTAYASKLIDCRDTLDSYKISNSELCYEDVASENMYQSFFSEFSENCTNSYFLYDCKGCTNCFGCTNLRNKSYYIWNEPYTKEEYFEKLKTLDFKSHTGLKKLQEQFEELKQKALRRYANFHKVEHSTGDNLSECYNLTTSFDLIDNVRDSKWLIHGGLGLADCYDCYGAGDRSELLYETIDTGVSAQKLLFDIVVWASHDVSYSWNCHGCHDCFGCIGLRNASYCIFNKQHTEDEYREMLPKVIEHMNSMPYVDKKGVKYGYGEFFPNEIGPFAYNETIVNDYVPLDKATAETKGFLWREPPESKTAPTLKAEDLPECIADTTDSIAKEVIACESCGRPFRIIKMELDFLKRFELPLPHKCPECRHRRRFQKVNLPKLYSRQCMCDYSTYKNSTSHSHHPTGQCSNIFETTYAPDRLEIVYCEECYNAEIL